MEIEKLGLFLKPLPHLLCCHLSCPPAPPGHCGKHHLLQPYAKPYKDRSGRKDSVSLKDSILLRRYCVLKQIQFVCLILRPVGPSDYVSLKRYVQNHLARS